ncbi:MAG TPA: VWA domain-containing protein [Dehalococcoidia bacterium]|jgi:VWFA-related protein|nr:VWA domain-containing protein [Dehalococcoidia bacterium]
MRRWLALTAAGLIFAASSVSAFGQESAFRANIASVSDDAYPNAKIIVNLEDDSPEGLPALGPEQFTVTANGNAVSVVAAELASSQDEPLDLTLVLDTSGSMAGAAMTNAKDAAKALIAELAPNDRVAVIGFADQVVVVQDYTSDRAAVNAAIDGLVAQGNTALYQATAVAAFKAVSSTATRKAVVLLSDGADFGGASAATREEAVNAARNAGVPYFTIAQGSDLDLPYLQEVSDVSKGRLLEAVNPAELRDLYLGIGRILRNQYIITFDASAVAALPESTIAVTVTAGARTATDESTYRPAPGFAPVLDISGIRSGETIDEARDILVNVAGATSDTRVTFFVDGASAAESATSPYVFTFNPEDFPGGDHTIRVVVERNGAPIEASIAFATAPPVAAASGGGLPILPIAIVAIAVAVSVGGLMLFKRRHHGSDISRLGVTQRTVPWAQQIANGRAAPSMPLMHPEEPPEVEQESIGEPLGILISRGGNDLGAEYTVGAAPVSIGSGARCGVRIDDPDLAAEEARTWVRGGHLMVHRMTRLSVIAADGTSGGWMILEAGDTLTIGEHVFEFRILDAGLAPAPDAEPSPSYGTTPTPIDRGPAPNVLRDPAEPGHFAPETERRFRMTEMMPSSELAPSASYDDDDAGDAS